MRGFHQAQPPEQSVLVIVDAANLFGGRVGERNGRGNRSEVIGINLFVKQGDDNTADKPYGKKTPQEKNKKAFKKRFAHNDSSEKEAR